MSLTFALSLSLAVAAGSGPSRADALSTKDLGRVKLKVPSVWKSTLEEGTRKFEAPSHDASFSLDAFPWEGDPISGEACRDKLTAALGGQRTWEKLTIGGAAAAHSVVTDRLEDGKTQTETHTWVGCDGRTKWVLTFSYTTSKKERFAPLAERVAKSLIYK
ncbi:MAG: hypothetical protein IRZ16_02285 [Myxococcaceae bacterium]|nr:hypothetical protein [Myxococcaceae bacterium]